MDCTCDRPNGVPCPLHHTPEGQAEIEKEIAEYGEQLPLRVETGPLRFGDDWPGVFIRGDHANHFAAKLRQVLASKHAPSAVDAAILDGLASTLEGCRWQDGPPDGTVTLKPYGECLPDGAEKCPSCSEWFAGGRIGGHLCDAPKVQP